MSAFNEKLSVLVKSQLPDFVQENNETLVAFLKAYYEYLEQDEKAQKVLQTARSYADVDTTIDSFVNYFLNEFAYGIPEYIFEEDQTAAKRFLVKYIVSLYRSKGSPNALKFLFRLAFDEEIDVVYPYDYLLRPSDGKYSRTVAVKVLVDETVDMDLITERTIYGEESLLESAVDYYIKDPEQNIYEFFLEERGLFETADQFIPGERLISSANITGSITVLPVLTDVIINDPGLGYQTTDSIAASDSNIVLSISSVDETGAIRSIGISHPGDNVTSVPTLTYGFGSGTRDSSYVLTANVATIVLNDNLKHGLHQGDIVNVTVATGTLASNNYVVSDVLTNKAFRISVTSANTSGNLTLAYRKQANLTPIVGSLVRTGQGYGISLDGQLDTIILIQDSFKWQQYSYVIRSNLNVDRWADLVKEVLHPAGLAVFGEVNVFTAAGESSAAYAGPVRGQEAYEAFIQYLFEIISESPGSARMGQPDSFYTIELEYSSQYIDSSVSRYATGATLQTIDRYKFEYGNAFPINIITSNEILGGLLTAGDFVLNKNKKSNFQPPSFVDQLNRTEANANVIYTMSINT